MCIEQRRLRTPIHLMTYLSPMKILFRLVIVTFYTGLFQPVVAQTSIKLMSYNTLNFPNGIIPNRQDSLKQIIDYVQPDLLLLQEVRNALGLNQIVTQSFSGLGNNYAASTFIFNQSSSFELNQLQQAIVYNTDIFGLAGEYWRTTALRDINVYKLYLKDQEALSGGDTTFVYTFVTHLKAGQGSDNEQQRLAMIEVFVDELANIPLNSYVLFGGDFNLYRSTEPAYQLMLSTQNAITMEDPIDAPGNWTSSNYPFREVHTQSTREVTIFGDGAGSGMDDRFDFVLVSSNLKSSSSSLRYKTGSYKALGNNGTCYNQSITNCSVNNEVPLSILQSLYFFSDHLPVVLELETDLTLAMTEEHSPKPNDILLQYGNELLVSPELAMAQVVLTIFDLNGRMRESRLITPGERYSLTGLNRGIYIATVSNSQNGVLLDRKKIAVY